MDFYERVHLLFKRRQVSDCQKKISFVQNLHGSNNATEIHILTSDDIKIYY